MIAGLQPLLAAQVSGQVIAVLEHAQCAEDQSRVVRPLFVRESMKWRPVRMTDGVPAGPATWFSVGSGSHEYKIDTSTPPPRLTDAWLFVRDYRLKPTSPLPKLPNADMRFSGWCEPPANQPLALGSGRPSTARAAPRSVPTSPSAHPPLLRALLASYGAKSLCAYSASDPDKAVPFVPKSSDLAVHTSLEVASGLRLVALELKRPAFDCRSELGASDLPRWFAVGQRIQYLGASMDYVDTIFASPDGKPDLLFWYSGYNEDGYILLNGTLTLQAKFTWKYH